MISKCNFQSFQSCGLPGCRRSGKIIKLDFFKQTLSHSKLKLPNDFNLKLNKQNDKKEKTQTQTDID